jgi:hypothetical protein
MRGFGVRFFSARGIFGFGFSGPNFNPKRQKTSLVSGDLDGEIAVSHPGAAGLWRAV